MHSFEADLFNYNWFASVYNTLAVHIYIYWFVRCFDLDQFTLVCEGYSAVIPQYDTHTNSSTNVMMG